MNISNNFRSYNVYSVRNNAQNGVVQSSSSNPAPKTVNKSISFGTSHNPLINLMVLEALTAPPPSKPIKKSKKPTNEYRPSEPSRHISEDQLREYKQTALDNDIIVKGLKRDYDMHPALVNMEIDGKDYNFYTNVDNENEANFQAAYSTDSTLNRKRSSWGKDADKLYVLIRNVKDQHRGRFVQDGRKDVLIPFVASQKPDINKDEILLKYGNAEFPEVYSGFNQYCAIDSVRKAIGKDIDVKDLKPIEYVEKMGNDMFAGQPNIANDNLERKHAFGYYDEDTGVKCLYFENKGLPKQIVKQDETGNTEVIELG